MSNSIDPDETAHYEPSHLDLRCLQKHIAEKELSGLDTFSEETTLSKLFCLPSEEGSI